MKESLSALLDGECSASELDRVLAEMDRNPALREQFSRQCLARDGRMGTRVRSADLAFADRVLAALQDDPAVVPFGDRVRRLPWRAATSLAAAAALGAIAVLVVQPQGPADSQVPVRPGAMVQTAAMPAGEPADLQFAELEGEHARQLRNYVMAYSQSRGQQGVGATLGYARYAAYTDSAPAARATEAVNQP